MVCSTERSWVSSFAVTLLTSPVFGRTTALWVIRPAEAGRGGCASLGRYFNKALSLHAAEQCETTTPMLSLLALTKGYKSPLGSIITRIILSIMILVNQEC